MNSVLAVTFLDTGKSMTLKLVFPDKSNYKKALISVLSPLGCALLGYKAGDLVTYRTSEVNQIVRIDKIIYQPEAYGEDLILA